MKEFAQENLILISSIALYNAVLNWKRLRAHLGVASMYYRASKCKWYRYVYFPSLDYRLWNSCGVPLPPMDCEDHGLTFNVPATIQNNCTIVDEYIVEGTKEISVCSNFAQTFIR